MSDPFAALNSTVELVEPAPSLAEDGLDPSPLPDTAAGDEQAEVEIAAGQLNLVDEIEQTIAGDDAKTLVHEWIGLPMFREDEQVAKVVVSFDSEEDRQRFLDGIGVSTIQKTTRGTLSVKWPDRLREDLSSLRFVAPDLEEEVS